MTILDARPDPQTVSHEAVATVARQRAAALFEDVILRDAKIQEQQQYIATLEARVAELEAAAVAPQREGRRASPPEAHLAPAEG